MAKIEQCSCGAIHGLTENQVTDIGRKLAAFDDLVEACRAALVYDKAIWGHSEATAKVMEETNNPIAAQHVESDSLDTLYERWIGLVHKALAKASPKG